MKNRITILCLVVSQSICFAQATIKTIEVPEGIHKVYLDRAGDFYIHQKDTVLKRYNADGKLLAQSKIDFASIFDPWYGINLLHYISPNNFYRLLDLNLEFKSRITVDSAFAIEPYLICLSGEKNIWLLDKADWSVKRINYANPKVIFESRLSLSKNAKITFIREYQNFLFVLDKNSGILIYNSIGNYVNKIESTNIEYFNFLGEELYYKKGDQLFFHDLFDSKSRSESLDPSIQQIFFTDKHVLKAYANRLEIVDK